MSMASSTATSGVDYGVQSRGVDKDVTMMLIVGAVVMFIIWLFRNK